WPIPISFSAVEFKRRFIENVVGSSIPRDRTGGQSRSAFVIGPRSPPVGRVRRRNNDRWHDTDHPGIGVTVSSSALTPLDNFPMLTRSKKPFSKINESFQPDIRVLGNPRFDLSASHELRRDFTRCPGSSTGTVEE